MARLSVVVPPECDDPADHPECQRCAVEKLDGMPGVTRVEATGSTLELEYEPKAIDAILQAARDSRSCRMLQALAEKLPESKPRSVLAAGAHWVWHEPGLRRMAISGLLLAIGWLLEAFVHPNWIAWPILLASGILSSTKTFPGAVEALRKFALDIDVLMFAAAIGAALIGHPAEGALLLFLFGLGNVGEELALARASVRRSLVEDGAGDGATADRYW
ncbi:MAG: hypothetical protein QM770_16155 [Tepidisphaeraceae bacterium]